MTAPPSAHEGRRRTIVLVGLLLGVILAAVDATVIAVAMPVAVADLGGEALYGWAFSAYMLTTAASMPFWGSGSDRWGRRRLFLIGVGILIGASLLAAAAPTMPIFLAGRALQGVGAGAMFAIPMTILGVVYPPHRRGRALGVVTSAWGLASVFGPLAGSGIVAALGWRWVFYVNAPIGLVAAGLILYALDESTARRPGDFDLLGGVVLAAATSLLLLAFTSLGGGTGANGILIWGGILGALLLLAVFFRVEKGADDPVLPLEAFRSPGFAGGALGAFFGTFGVFGLVAFVPLAAENLHGVLGPTVVITALGMGWSGAALASGRVLHATGERRLVLPGMILLGAAAPLLVRVVDQLPLAAVAAFATGLGMGIMTPSLTTSVQNSVPVEHMGTATGSVQFLRQIGSALGVGAFGLLFHLYGIERAAWVTLVAAAAGLAVTWRLPTSSLHADEDDRTLARG